MKALLFIILYLLVFAVILVSITGYAYIHRDKRTEPRSHRPEEWDKRLEM